MKHQINPNNFYEHTFKEYLIKIESDLGELDHSAIAERNSDIEGIFNELGSITMDSLSSQYPEIRRRSIPNRVQMNNIYNLVQAALHTAASTGKFLSNFDLSHIKNLDEIIFTIKPLVRDLLKFNLSFNHLVVDFAKTKYTEGVYLSHKTGQLEIREPSYFHTAKVLSEYFRDPQKIAEMDRIFRSLIGTQDNQDSLNAVNLIEESLCRVIVLNPREIVSTLYGAFINSKNDEILTIRDLLTDDLGILSEARNNFESLIFYSLHSSSSGLYLNMANMILNNLDRLLIDSPFKDQIIGLYERGQLYPVVTDRHNIDPTYGCPGYFHNTALKYVATGLYISGLMSSRVSEISS